MAIKIKGKDTRVRDGVEGVYNTTADMAFKSLTTHNNKLELSKLKTQSLKDSSTKEFVNMVLYPKGTKQVNKTSKDGKEYSIKIDDAKTLDRLNYTKTHTYNFATKKRIALEKPIELFNVGSTVEDLLNLTFPAFVVDGLLEYKPKDSQEIKTKSKMLEFIIPKNYDKFIMLNYENIRNIATNLSTDLDSSLKKAKIADAKEPNKEHYVESPQVGKNLGRLYALLESYPNILPLLPTYVISLPIIQEAFVKGKQLENVLDIDFKLANVTSYDFKTHTSVPVFDRIETLVNSNSLSKDKLSTLQSNIMDEFNKIDIKFEDIKSEYEIAKSDIDAMQKLPVYDVEKTTKQGSEVSAEDLEEIYGAEEVVQETAKEIVGLEGEIEDISDLNDIFGDLDESEDLEEKNEDVMTM